MLRKAAVRAAALEEEGNRREHRKMPEEALMAARTFEERKLTAGNSPNGERNEHADQKLWRAHGDVHNCISNSDAQKDNEPNCIQYAPHAQPTKPRRKGRLERLCGHVEI